MKAALCISGQMRTYRECRENLKKYIIDPLNPDIFVHTWTNSGITTKAEQKVKKGFRDEKVTYSILDEFYQPRKAIIEEFKDSYAEEMNGVRVPDMLKEAESQHYKGAIPMFYKMYACNELKRRWEREHNFRYDMVIKSRPDMLVAAEIPAQVKENLDILWFSDCKVNPRVQVSDKFAISCSAHMDYYCSVWKHLSQYWEEPLGDGEWKDHRVGERLMRFHLEQSGIEFRPFSMACDILRNPLPKTGRAAAFLDWIRHLVTNKK
jgi:hypothetical protein